MSEEPPTRSNPFFFCTVCGIDGAEELHLRQGRCGSSSHMLNSPSGTEPVLSVIIPVYNGRKYLADTLRSLAALEEVMACELIFQDNLSTDGTGEVLREFCADKDNRFHCVEPDGGQSDAINLGMCRARGRWVTWLCADDMLLPAVAASLEDAEETGADLVYGNVAMYADGSLFPAIGTERHAPGILARKRLTIQQPGTCIRRKAWQEMKGVRRDLHWSMDYDLFLRMESAGKKFFRTHRFLAVIRIHREAKTSSGSIRRLLEIWSVLAAGHRRRPSFFRFQPYIVYGLEFCIKAIEAAEPLCRIMRRSRLLHGMHAFFWLIAGPAERQAIEEGFRALPGPLFEFSGKNPHSGTNTGISAEHLRNRKAPGS